MNKQLPMMKKQLLFILLMAFSLTTYAQVGVGTPLPNASSQLEVVSSDRGVLISQIALQSSVDVISITNGNVTSLLVYNTSTVANDITPGYHYWDGSKWQRITNSDDVADIVSNLETLTTLVDNGDGTITYTDEDGGTTTIDIGAMVSANETVTTLVNNGDGTFTYTSEDGTVTVINSNSPNIVDNGDGTYTVTNGDGTTSIIDTNAASSMVTDGTIDVDGDGTPDNGITVQDVINNIENIIDANETLTVISQDIAAGTITYKDEDGADTVLDIAAMIAGNETLTTYVDNGDGTSTYTDEDGVANTINNSAIAENVLIEDGTVDIDGDGTPDNGVTLQDVIDNLDDIVAANETVTTLADNTDGTYTYTSEDGTTTGVDTNAASSMVTDGTIDVDGDGTPDNGITVQDVINNIENIIDANETLTVISQDIAAGTITYKDEDGADTVLDIAAMIAGNETLTTYVDNGDGTSTYTDEDGVVNTINNSAIAENVLIEDGTVDIDGDGTPDNGVTLQDVIDNLDDIVAANETVTTLADNTDGTYTYTSEDGTMTGVDTNAASSMVTDGTIDVDGDGTPDNGITVQDVINNIENIIDANETLTVISQDIAAGTITYKDEDGADTVLDIAAMIAGNETLTTYVDNGDGTSTYTDEDGVANTINNSAIAENVLIEDGTVDIDGDGTPDNGVTLQDVIDNLDDIVAANETVTTLVDNTDGTFTYTSEDGTVTVIDVNNPSITDNNDGTYTVTNADGTTATIDTTAGSNPLDAPAVINGVAVTTVQEAINALAAQAGVVSTLVNTDGTYTYTDEAGTITSFDVTQTGGGDPNVNLTIGAAGDVYVDENTGDVWTHDGTTWMSQSSAANEPWFGTDDNAGATDNTEDIYTMGNVGIGTTTPIEILNIEKNTDASGSAYSKITNTGDGHVGYLLDREGVNETNWAMYSNANSENLYFYGYTDAGGFGTNTLTLTPDTSGIPHTGRVGIMTEILPTHTLDVNGMVRVQDLTGTDAATDVIVTADATTGELKEGGTLAAAAAANEPWFGADDNMGATDNTEDIYSMGNVGIGTSTPNTSANLHILESIPNAIGAVRTENDLGFHSWLFTGGSTSLWPNTSVVQAGIRASGDASKMQFETVGTAPGSYFQFKEGGSSNVFMHIDAPTGNVGVGTTVPTERLEISGKLLIHDSFSNPSPQGGVTYLNDTGKLFIGAQSGSSANGAIIGVNGASVTDARGTGYVLLAPASYASNETVVISKPGVGVGLGPTEAATNRLHVKAPSNPFRLEGLVAGTTPATDEVLLTDATGVVKKGGTLAAAAAASEPWFGTDDDMGATDNTEDIYTLGTKVGVGIADPLAGVDVVTDANIGVKTLLQTADALVHTGVQNTLSGAGTGTQYGSLNIINNTGDGEHTGQRNILSGSGSGVHIGIRNAISGTGTGVQEGINNTIVNSGDASHTGLRNGISGSGSGIHTGISNFLSGAGTGTQFGINNLISTSGDATHTGTQNNIFGIGSGIHTGMNNLLSGAGTGVQNAITSTISNTGDATHYAIRNTLSGSGSGTHYGIHTHIINGTGDHYGVYNNLQSINNGNKYGTYNRIPAVAGGSTHYAVYGEAEKVGTNIFAGYFKGKVAVTNLTGTDAATDVIVTADATTGELKEGGTLAAAAAASEPWFGVDDNAGATDNTEDVYTMGKVGIGTDTPSNVLVVENNTATDGTADALINDLTVGKGNGNRSNSTAFGVSSLALNTTGPHNTAIGNSTLSANTTGGRNTAIGSRALTSNTTGVSNTAVGWDSGNSNTTGNSNSSLGVLSLTSNTIGENNVAVGSEALTNSTVGAFNTSIGTNSLRDGIDLENNTAIGGIALVSLVNGGNNIAVGYRAGRSQLAGNNNIFIGVNGDVPDPFGSFQMNIGNIIYGENIDGQGPGISSGNIGIGISTPTEKLDVDGNIKASGNLQSGTTTYPDYVFETAEKGGSTLNKNYTFKTLNEVEVFIKTNKHLPGVTGINELEKTDNGYNVNVTAMSVQTLEKVEELFLHTIAQEKKLEALTKENEALKTRLAKIEAALGLDKN